MKKTLFLSFLLFCFLFFLAALPVLAQSEFYDDFSDSNFTNRWNIIYVSPEESNPVWDLYDWGIVEGRLGITLGRSGMRTYAVLNSWSLSNYTFSFDILGRRGEDKNILFRYRDEDNWYGFHTNNTGTYFGFRKNGNYSDFRVSNFSFSNGISYHVGVTIFDDIVSLVVNGEEIVTRYKISDNFISSGGIGLKVSTGANYPSEVYFDNVRISKVNTPVILVPGLGASFNFKEMFLGQSDPGGWQMTPGVHVYDNIIASLEANGYEEGKDLFIFNYNWLNSVSDSADYLYQLAEEITDSSGFSEINVIGHSLGGLVARSCFQEKENSCFIDHLITVGSPHQGVLETYAAWEGGEIWRSGLTKMAFELFLNTQKGPLETDKEALRRLAPSTLDMLPNFTYLRDEQGNEIEFGSENYPQNRFLSIVAGTEAIKDKADFVFGSNHSTLRWLTVDKNLSWYDQVLGNWEFGKPIGEEFSDSGDGTVLTLSAYPSDDLSGHVFDLGHREIIADPVSVAKIMTILELEPTSDLTLTLDEENFLVLYLHSPAHLEITNHLGKVLFGEDDQGVKLAIVSGPSFDEDYFVDVVGDNSGSYQLTVGKVSGSESSWSSYGGNISAGKTDSFRINFSSPTEVTTNESIQPIEELFQNLRTIDISGLDLKVNNWQELAKANKQQALIYGYRLRNWLSLLVRSSSVDFNLVSVLSRVDLVIAYLEELILSEENQPITDGHYDAISEFFLAGLSDFDPKILLSGSLEKLAAFDFLKARRYQTQIESSSNQPDCYNLVRSFSGIGLLRNSKVLLQN